MTRDTGTATLTLRGNVAQAYLVVAGADDGPDGLRVIETAASALANRVGGELHILHLAPESELRSEATLALLEHGRDSLDHVAASLHEPTRARAIVHIRSGSPWREIVHEARTRMANLVVVGTHGRTGAARLLIGSQEEEVVRHAPCPVLVVRDAYPIPAPEPTIEPPCPECVQAQESPDGDEPWCAEHRRVHVTPHLHYAFPPGFGGGSALIRP